MAGPSEASSGGEEGGWGRRVVRYNNPGSGSGHGFGYWAQSELLHPTRKGRRPQTSRMPLRGCANSTVPNKAAKPREPPPGWPLEPLDPCALGTYPPAPIPSPSQKPRLRGGEYQNHTMEGKALSEEEDSNWRPKCSRKMIFPVLLAQKTTNNRFPL